MSSNVWQFGAGDMRVRFTGPTLVVSGEACVGPKQKNVTLLNSLADRAKTMVPEAGVSSLGMPFPAGLN